MEIQPLPLMQLEASPINLSFNIRTGKTSKVLSIPKTETEQLICICRKDVKGKSQINFSPANLNRIIFPQCPGLSSQHAIVTVKTKNLEPIKKVVDKLLGYILKDDIISIVMDFLVSETQVCIKDLGSTCGTFIRAGRPLRLQQFYIYQGEVQHSLAFYFCSTPQMKVQMGSDPKLIKYIQESQQVDCSDKIVLEKIRNCCLSNYKEVAELNKLILASYSVAVLSHNKIGYSFILGRKQKKFRFKDLFEGTIEAGTIDVETRFQLFTNICKEKNIRTYNHSQTYRIKARDTLVLGDSRFEIDIRVESQ